jgi:hypothetical protein
MSYHNGRIVRITVIKLFAFLLFGCARRQQPTATPLATMTPPPPSYLSKEEATIRAVEVASTDEFHFTGTIEEPTNVRAELLPFEEAVTNLQAQGFQSPSAADLLPETMVWIVTMEGRWPRNFPPLQDGEPAREPYRRLAVILEAETGDRLDLSVPTQ